MIAADTEMLLTRHGTVLHVRPAREEDEPALAAFFANVSPQDLRFRFLTGVRVVSHERLSGMIRANDATSESLIAFDDGGSIVAAAMLAGDDTLQTAEAAVAIRRDMKAHGIGWTLLDHLVGHAKQRDIARSRRSRIATIARPSRSKRKWVLPLSGRGRSHACQAEARDRLIEARRLDKRWLGSSG